MNEYVWCVWVGACGWVRVSVCGVCEFILVHQEKEKNFFKKNSKFKTI